MADEAHQAVINLPPFETLYWERYRKLLDHRNRGINRATRPPRSAP